MNDMYDEFASIRITHVFFSFQVLTFAGVMWKFFEYEVELSKHLLRDQTNVHAIKMTRVVTILLPDSI